MKFARYVAVLVCCCVAVGCWKFGEQDAPKKLAKQDGPREAGRHVESTGRFSYVPPPGWTMRDFPGLRYKIVHTTPVNGFAPNLNVTDEMFRGTVDTYADQNLAALKTALPGFKLLAAKNSRPRKGCPA